MRPFNGGFPTSDPRGRFRRGRNFFSMDTGTLIFDEGGSSKRISVIQCEIKYSLTIGKKIVARNVSQNRIPRLAHSTLLRFACSQRTSKKFHLLELLVQSYPLVGNWGSCVDPRKSYGLTKSSSENSGETSVDSLI